MKKKWIVFIAVLSFLVFATMATIAGAYQTYSDGCVNCHGDFRANTYNSLAGAKVANPAWPGTTLALHNGHANASTENPPGMLNGNCNACHFGGSRIPVYTYQSNDAAPFGQGCAGCHDGSGLRAHHVNSGADTCYDCHSDPTPDAENILRPVYAAAFGTASGTTGVNDACNPASAGFEGRLKDVTSLGLDNDGNLLYDQNDPACAPAAAIISVAPTTLSFGNQAVGTTSATQTVTISNPGSAILSVTGITNSNTTDYMLTAPALPFNVAAAGSQTFTVSFRPGGSGAKSAIVSITSNGGSATVSASGTGVAPVLSVSPASLTFGSQTIGTTSAAQTLTLFNIGTGTLNVSGITSSNAEFASSLTSVAPIAAGGSAKLSISFAPAASGARSSNISILSNGGNATVSASGTGVTAGALSVSPATLTYTNQTVGTTSNTQTVTVSNTGGSALTVNSFFNSNTTDFVLAAPATPLTINGGASQTFTVAFKPAASGSKSSTLTVDSSAGSATVSASGSGVAVTVLQPKISISLLSLTFSNATVGTKVSQAVTISNTGNAALSITNMTKAGSAAFSFSPASFSAIAAGANVTLTVTYAPTSVGTDAGATLNISSNGGSVAVSLAGNAVQQTTSGDVALAKLSVPSSVTVRTGQSSDILITAQATTTIEEIGATVTLNSAGNSNVNVSFEQASLTKEIKSGVTEQQKYDFKAKISCSAKGIWPVTWKAKISAAKNSNTKNDILMGTTQVTCSSAGSSSSSSR